MATNGSRRSAAGAQRAHSDRIVVLFDDDVDLTGQGTLAAQVDSATGGGWRKLTEAYSGLRIQPLFADMERSSVDRLVKRAVELDPTYRPANFHGYAVVQCSSRDEALAVAAQVAEWRGVREAYVEGGPTPPPMVMAVDDPRSINQGYLDPAPDGIDAEYAWTRPGGDGAGVGFVDLEQGWTLGHEDLVAAGVTLISGTNSAYFGHGTSVLGEVVSVDNTIGCVGIAPACTARVVSQYQPSGYNTAQAILSAAAVMDFGDVLLLEAQTSAPGYGYLPVEIETAAHEAIRLATALGVVVVEAAGNGSEDLDAYTNGGGAAVLNRSSADFRDSGAVMVGAGSAVAPHFRLSFSNFGSRVDCYGWGQSIDTTGDGWTGNATTTYTTSFGGTSGASPIVAGAAVLLQSISTATRGYRFSPAQMRILLSDPATGTASDDPATDLIGVMPNLRQIIDTSLPARSDVYLRDFVGDLGEPHSGAISSSPDVILRTSPVADPQASFGAGSGTENSATLSDAAEFGQDNHIYVRVLNQGGQSATNVDCSVYWSPVSTLATPNLWNLIGTATIATVPVGEILTVSDSIVWPAADIPAPGHYCFVALVGADDDPAPSPADFVDWDNFRSFIRNNNNVTWRNFNVVDNVPPPGAPPPGFVPLPFVFAGAADRGLRFDLEVAARLPRGAQLFLQLDPRLAERLPVKLETIKPDKKSGEVRALKAAAQGRTRLGTAHLPAKSTFGAVLYAAVPKEHRHHEFTVMARQLFEGEEVGRVTWRLVPAKAR
jgi:serine protease